MAAPVTRGAIATGMVGLDRGRDRYGYGKRDFQAESGIKDRKAGSTMGKERKPTCNCKTKDRSQQKGEWRRGQGKKKTTSIKTH